MKESMWGYLIISLGIVIIAVILLVQRLTTTNEQDYFLSREAMKGAMLDAIEFGSDRSSEKLVMSKEKFVAIFTRRFAESVPADRTYQIDFYDIHEYPPKATVKISTKSGETVIKDTELDLDINTYITGILETREKKFATSDHDGWVYINEKDSPAATNQRWVFYKDGVALTGKHKLASSNSGGNEFYYFFNSSGIMQVGWVRYPNGNYYLYSPIDKDNNGRLDGRRIQSMSAERLRVLVNGTKTYYVDKEGLCHTCYEGECVCGKNDIVNVTNIVLQNKNGQTDWSLYRCNGDKCN